MRDSFNPQGAGNGGQAVKFGPIPPEECRNHLWQIKGPDAEIRCKNCNDVPALPHVVQNEMIRELQRGVYDLGMALLNKGVLP